MRAIALLWVVYGSVLLLGGGLGIAMWLGGQLRRPLPPIAVAVMAVVAPVGALGIIGGIGILRKQRRWAKMAYGIAFVYLPQIPIGTILGGYLLLNLQRYLRLLDMFDGQEDKAGEKS